MGINKILLISVLLSILLIVSFLYPFPYWCLVSACLAKQWCQAIRRGSQHERQLKKGTEGAIVAESDSLKIPKRSTVWLNFTKMTLTARHATSAEMWFYARVETPAICWNICLCMALNMKTAAPSPGGAEQLQHTFLSSSVFWDSY